MATKLEQLLEALDPSRSLNDLSAGADAALNSFKAPSARVENWEEFKTCLGEFFRHVENTILQVKSPPRADLDFYWGRCAQVLNEEFGPRGHVTAFRMANAGLHGGLYAVLRAVAERMAVQYADNGIKARVSDFWHGLSVEEQLSIPLEYARKYGSLLPPELLEGDCYLLKANFWKVLEEHPRLIQRMRRVGR